eukprot:1356547-Rhodomonas_salina.1
MLETSGWGLTRRRRGLYQWGDFPQLKQRPGTRGGGREVSQLPVTLSVNCVHGKGVWIRSGRA